MTHRINNQLASTIDVVTTAAGGRTMAKVALGNVAELLQEQANLHLVLTIPEGDAEGAGAKAQLACNAQP